MEFTCEQVDEVISGEDDMTPRLAEATGLSEEEVEAEFELMGQAGYTPEQAMARFSELAERRSGTRLVVVDVHS